MFWYTTPLRSMETVAESGFVPGSDEELAPRLMVILGREPGKTFPIALGESSVGRDTDCQITLLDPSVSRKHARLVRAEDGSVTVVDDASTNGTHVNDRKISRSALNNGDILRVGNVLLKFYEPGTIEAEVFQRVFQMAMTDPLTETLTKAAITYHLETTVANDPQRLAIIMVDLDHFKQVNDTYGHMAGDVVLKQLAAALKSRALRTGDLIGRFGGEEFLIILPETSLETACQVAETARQAVQETVTSHNGQAIRLTSSFGVTIWQAADEFHPNPPQAMLERADQALYKAKKDGRNQVCTKI